MVEEWTKDQENQITSIYGQLRGKYESEANKKLFGGQQLPYLEAFNTLTSLIDEQKKSSGLEAKAGQVSKESSSGIWSLPTLTRPQAAFGLTTMVLLLAYLV